MRAITRDTLEAYGYVVLTATNGADALAIYSRHKDSIDVVLTDTMMPIMDGIALTRAISEINPGVRVILASGSIQHGISQSSHRCRSEAIHPQTL